MLYQGILNIYNLSHNTESTDQAKNTSFSRVTELTMENTDKPGEVKRGKLPAKDKSLIYFLISCMLIEKLAYAKYYIYVLN